MRNLPTILYCVYIVLLSMMLQESETCWSTSDCPVSVCPVPDCPESDRESTIPPVSETSASRTPVTATVAPPALLTAEQSNTLKVLGQQLENMSCEAVEERVFNTTIESPIQLTDDQTMAIKNFYPASFNTFNPEQFFYQCSSTNSPQKRSVVVSVCESSIVYKTYNLALDKFGEPVYLPQNARFDLEQKFKENLCTKSACVSSLGCKCEDQVSHTGMALVSYLKNNNQKFYNTEIQLRTCSGFL